MILATSMIQARYRHVASAVVTSAALACAPLALAHGPAGTGGDTGTGTGDRWQLWSFDPWVVLPLIISAALYLFGLRRLWSSSRPGAGIRILQAWSFGAGWLALTVALVTPLDGMGGALFWVHMVQHEVLMLVAAPLLVLGRPVPVWLWALPLDWRRRLGSAAAHPCWMRPWRQMSAPFQSWLLHALVLWVWHVPVLFQLAVTNPAAHTLQHTSFLISALLFWWAILQYRRASGGALSAICSLLTTAIHTAILGALLTFSGRVWYPIYTDSAASYGLTALEDQQLGGLIMWVPAGLVYLAAAVAIIWQVLLHEPSGSALPRADRGGT